MGYALALRGLAAEGTTWPAGHVLSMQLTPLLLLSAASSGTQSQGWVADHWHLSPAPTWAHQRGRRAHWPIWFLGCVGWPLILSRRAFSRKGENALRKEELARRSKNNKHLPFSPQTPTSKIILNDTILIHTLDFLPEKSILQDTQNPAPQVRFSQCSTVNTVASTQPLGHLSLWPLCSPSAYSSPLRPSPSKPHTFSNPRRIHLPYSFLPQHCICT